MIYSFFEFSKNILTGCGNVLPVMYASDVAFYWNEAINSVALCSQNGDLIKDNLIGYYSSTRQHFKLNDEPSAILVVNTCFRLRISTSTGYYYSNLCAYVECEDSDCSSTLAYSCHVSQFGFDYSENSNKYNTVSKRQVFA